MWGRGWGPQASREAWGGWSESSVVNCFHFGVGLVPDNVTNLPTQIADWIFIETCFVLSSVVDGYK